MIRFVSLAVLLWLSLPFVATTQLGWFKAGGPDANEPITNELIDEVNRGWDPARIAAEAKAYKYAR